MGYIPPPLPPRGRPARPAAPAPIAYQPETLRQGGEAEAGKVLLLLLAGAFSLVGVLIAGAFFLLSGFVK